MRLTDADLLAWMQTSFWVFTRIAAALSIAPVLGHRQTPMRLRLMLALALTVLVTPMLPTGEPLRLWSADWWLTLLRQFLIGAAMGFVLRLVFESVLLAGELIANSMGLGFAQLADPVNGNTAAVTGSFLTIIATLLFLALGGHLMLIEALVHSFRSLPLEHSGLSAGQIYEVALWALNLFAGGLRIALPVLVSLLLVNLAFGVVSRAAPTLNLMSVGLPLSLVAGLLLMQFSLPGLQTAFAALLESAVDFIASIGHG